MPKPPTGPLSQSGKDKLLIGQAATCLENAAAYAADGVFKRSEDSLKSALNQIKEIKAFPNPLMIEALMGKVREMDNEVRKNRAHPENFAPGIKSLAEETRELLQVYKQLVPSEEFETVNNEEGD